MVAPVSTLVQLVVIAVPLLAGLGVVAQTGCVGAALSTIKPVDCVIFVFPAASLTVIVVSDPSRLFCPTVPVHMTLPVTSAGEGEQTIPITVTVASFSTAVSNVVITVPLLAGEGRVDVTFGSAGAMVSIVTASVGECSDSAVNLVSV